MEASQCVLVFPFVSHYNFIITSVKRVALRLVRLTIPGDVNCEVNMFKQNRAKHADKSLFFNDYFPYADFLL